MLKDPVVIVSAARTPMGAFQGELKDFAAPQLGAAAIRAAVERAGVKPEQVQEAIMGCVLSAGQGQAPARQAALGAGLPLSTGCTTVNKMCGSGMKAAMFAHDLLVAGTNDIMVAGGMESMTNAPYLLPKARSGYRMGHQQVIDHMFLDGLEAAYDKGKLMGSFAEDGAASFVIMGPATAEKLGVKPLAVVVAHSTHSQEPGWFTTAPVGAIRKLFDAAGWTAGKVDLYEINEAFAVVTMAAMKEHGLPHEKVNVHGGACALGHPIGASGARILVTLIGALRKTGGKRGIASLCIGGGEATAMAIEIA